MNPEIQELIEKANKSLGETGLMIEKSLALLYEECQQTDSLLTSELSMRQSSLSHKKQILSSLQKEKSRLLSEDLSCSPSNQFPSESVSDLEDLLLLYYEISKIEFNFNTPSISGQLNQKSFRHTSSSPSFETVNKLWDILP
jgi:hypothetical protein